MKRIADMTPQDWNDATTRHWDRMQEPVQVEPQRPQRAVEPYPFDDPWPSAPLVEPF